MSDSQVRHHSPQALTPPRTWFVRNFAFGSYVLSPDAKNDEWYRSKEGDDTRRLGWIGQLYPTGIISVDTNDATPDDVPCACYIDVWCM